MNSSSISIDIDLLIQHRYKLILFFLLSLCGSVFAKIIIPEKNLTSRLVKFDDGLSRVNILAEKTLINTDEVIGRVIKRTKFERIFNDEIEKEKLFKTYRSNFKVFHYPNTNVLKLTASNTSAEMATNIVNTHINEYLNLSLERKKKTENIKINLIQSELEDTELKLQSEKKLLIDFANQNRVSLNLHLDENNLYELTIDNSSNDNLESPDLEVKLDLLKRNYKIYRGLVLSLKSRLETQKIEDALIPPIAELLDGSSPTKTESPRIIIILILISLTGLLCSLFLNIFARRHSKPE